MARKFSITPAWPMRATGGNGKQMSTVCPANASSTRSAAVVGESTVTGAPHSWQCGRPTRAQSRRR